MLHVATVLCPRYSRAPSHQDIPTLQRPAVSTGTTGAAGTASLAAATGCSHPCQLSSQAL